MERHVNKPACAQAQASLEMARAMRMKAPILQVMTTQQLFGISIAEISNPMVFEFMHVDRMKNTINSRKGCKELELIHWPLLRPMLPHPPIPFFPPSSHHAQPHHVVDENDESVDDNLSYRVCHIG